MKKLIERPIFNEPAERRLARNIMTAHGDFIIEHTEFPQGSHGGAGLAEAYRRAFGRGYSYEQLNDGYMALRHWVEAADETGFILSNSIQNC